MSRQTIVVVEDETAIAASVAARLRSEGFDVETAASGPEGVETCRRVTPDLVVLDWMLPGFDGVEACRRIQADRPVPVLFLTARDAETDVLVGLGVGADDYITKPFSPRELVARIRAVLRRTARESEPARIALGPYVLDLEGRRVVRGDEETHLTPTEFDLLATFARRPGRAFSRDELLAAVWDWPGAASSTRTVDSHVAALRRKLAPEVVRTIQRHGYALGDLT